MKLDQISMQALARALVVWCKRCALGYQIRSCEVYLALCREEGIAVGPTILGWQDQLTDLREQLRALEGC